MTKVFVYGTLKPGECNYERYCANQVIQQQAAIALGCLYDLPCGYPAMILGYRPVYGVVMTFRNDEVLQALDRLEDYESNRADEQNEYVRQKIDVTDLTQQPLGWAWVYIMSPERVKRMGGTLVLSGNWTAP